jgi:hypothetical protein
MYLVYIRPLFEYACEVWNNCGIGYSDKLEKLQLDAARIVTGLPMFTKLDAIKRKFDVVYVTGIGEKQDFCFFGIEYTQLSFISHVSNIHK